MGRKAWMAVGMTVIGVVFGVYCISKEVKLSEAGLYWAAVSASSVSYMHYNVKQKQNGN